MGNSPGGKADPRKKLLEQKKQRYLKDLTLR